MWRRRITLNELKEKIKLREHFVETIEEVKKIVGDGFDFIFDNEIPLDMTKEEYSESKISEVMSAASEFLDVKIQTLNEEYEAERQKSIDAKKEADYHLKEAEHYKKEAESHLKEKRRHDKRIIKLENKEKKHKKNARVRQIVLARMPVPTNKERKIIEKRTTQPLKELEKIKIYADEYLTKEIPKEELKYLNVELSDEEFQRALESSEEQKKKIEDMREEKHRKKKNNSRKT